MSTMNVFVGNLQLPPFPAGQPASEVYTTLKDAEGGGILVGPNGVGILNNRSLVPAGNYTYLPATAVVPREGEPLSKKPKGSGSKNFVSAEEEYWEKLLEPVADLPETAAQLQEFLVQTPVKLPVHDAFYERVKATKLLTNECPDEVAALVSIVECALVTMQYPSVMNEATSSAQLYNISGLFMKLLNESAPLSRRLENLYMLLDSSNPSSTETASQPLERLARPDFQLFVKGCLILRWENKVDYRSLAAAVHENTEKLKVWSSLFYGALPYVIGGCCAGNQFRWLRLRPDDGGIIRSDFISPSYELTSLASVAAFLHTNIRMHCLLQKLQEHLKDGVKVILYKPIERENGVTVTIYPHVVEKVIKEDNEGLRSELYTAVKHSKFLIHGEVQRLENTTILHLEPVGDPSAKPVTLEELENASHDIFYGLNDLHKAGYTHRDVRWENCIKVNVEGEWKWILIDLEAAGVDGEEWNDRVFFKNWDSHTLEGKEKKYTKVSDLHLLGKLIYGWLVGNSPVDRGRRRRHQVMKSGAEKMKKKTLPAAGVKKLFCKRPCKRCRTFGNDS